MSLASVLDPDEPSREIVLSRGWTSTCYQVLNRGIMRWVSAQGSSLVGFVRVGKMAIVAGAPVCSKEELPDAVASWESYADGQGLGICYFAAEARLRACLSNLPGYTQVVLGYQPEWVPQNFLTKVKADASLRAQLNRATNKGVSVREWSRKEAENNPALIGVLEAWLGDRGLPPLHFLVEPETLGDLRDRRVFVGTQDGEVVGFVTLCPVPARKGWLTEQFVRSPSAPNGTIELMLYRAIEAIAADQDEYVTMGMIPLVNRGKVTIDEPRWLSLIRNWARAHFTRFYNFRGLDEFKTKFHPDVWQPVVVIVKDNQFRLSHLRAIACAFTQTMPERALAIGIAKAVRREIHTARAFLFGVAPHH